MTIDFNIESTCLKININSQESEERIDVKFSSFQTVTDADIYEDSYEIIPKTTEQVMETKQKLMADDVTIRKIPFYETSNNTGGTTITIGKEV